MTLAVIRNKVSDMLRLKRSYAGAGDFLRTAPQKTQRQIFLRAAERANEDQRMVVDKASGKK
jgi:hypothetical protein